MVVTAQSKYITKENGIKTELIFLYMLENHKQVYRQSSVDSDEMP